MLPPPPHSRSEPSFAASSSNSIAPKRAKKRSPLASAASIPLVLWRRGRGRKGEAASASLEDGGGSEEEEDVSSPSLRPMLRRSAPGEARRMKGDRDAEEASPMLREEDSEDEETAV